MPTELPLSEDLLVGTKAIGEFLGVPKRIVYHWAATSKIPVFHMNKLIAARKTELRRRLSAEAA